MPKYVVAVDRIIALTACIEVDAPDEDMVEEMVQTLYEDGAFGDVVWHIEGTRREPIVDSSWCKQADAIIVHHTINPERSIDTSRSAPRWH